MSFLSGIGSGLAAATLVSAMGDRSAASASSAQTKTAASQSSGIASISDLGKALSKAGDAVESIGALASDVLSSPFTSAVLLYTAAGRLLR